MSVCHEDILMMLDWNNPEPIQERGVQLAMQCKDFSVFVQPVFPKYNKNVWENCAKVICRKSDMELQPYIPLLLEWLQDLNWPGAISILERLKSCKGEVFVAPFFETVQKALKNRERNEAWLCNLSVYICRPDVYSALNDAQKRCLKSI